MELYSRSQGALGISIGSSLALESIFLRPRPSYDPSRNPPQVVRLDKYQECWINISTLIRNISSAGGPGKFFDSPADHVLEILLTEIELISNIFQQEGSNVCKPVFYYCTYQSLIHGKEGKVTMRESTTLQQKSYDAKETMVLKKLSKQTDQVLEFDSKLRVPRTPEALILTHLPYDLCSLRWFKKLDLLESHTGILKEPKQWNTKYLPFGQDPMNHLPFHRELLFVFGDKNQIAPQPRKLRQTVYEMSIKEGWTPWTTMERIREAYRKNVMHPADLQLLMSF